MRSGHVKKIIVGNGGPRSPKIRTLMVHAWYLVSPSTSESRFPLSRLLQRNLFCRKLPPIFLVPLPTLSSCYYCQYTEGYCDAVTRQLVQRIGFRRRSARRGDWNGSGCSWTQIRRAFGPCAGLSCPATWTWRRKETGPQTRRLISPWAGCPWAGRIVNRCRAAS